VNVTCEIVVRNDYMKGVSTILHTIRFKIAPGCATQGPDIVHDDRSWLQAHDDRWLQAHRSS